MFIDTSSDLQMLSAVTHPVEGLGPETLLTLRAETSLVCLVRARGKQ
jgi:hypothetical protein